ncbi:uncharacterized protein LOC128227291 isoform X2 [Mya arenaria]|uniref:uncharacterized protein LOC128227291 isoform X2 n=1 Tax=Mya arenaria TaxID=6604 RepID=UPI0022E0EBB7|nr:uncharacterized protein LOC128227291 isoform X2 [Mya arenaria]
MGDYRHVGFIYVFMHFSRYFFSLSLACGVDDNGLYRFGPDCEHFCHCAGNKQCANVTGACKECERHWFGPGCQYYDIALDFNDEINKLYGSRHLDNLPHPGQQYSQQAHYGNILTCSSTDSASHRINRRNEPFWSIYFINNTRFYDFQLVLSNDETLRKYFNGFKIYIENLTSWGYTEDERNNKPPTERPSICYQHNRIAIPHKTMVVQCGTPMIGNSVRIEMANIASQLVLCDIKISAGINMAFGKRLTLSPNDASSKYSPTGAVDGNTINTNIHKCSGMYANDRNNKWMDVDLQQRLDINLVLLTLYKEAGFLATDFTIAVSNGGTFKTIYDNATDSRPMPGIFLSSKGQHLRIQQMNGSSHFTVCEIQVFARCVNRWTGKDGMCNKNCSISMWGEECEHPCGQCSNGAPCNVSNGHCKTCAAGYKHTQNCTDECEDGRYGPNCNSICSLNCVHTCSKLDGTCKYCKAGYTGKMCDKECENGTYGTNCSKPCGHCVAGCDKKEGSCLGGCLPGFTGDTCQAIG